MLQNIALTRYDVTVRVRVLTLGVLEGNVPELHEVEGSSMRDAAGEKRRTGIKSGGHAQSKEKGPLRPSGIQERLQQGMSWRHAQAVGSNLLLRQLFDNLWTFVVVPVSALTRPQRGCPSFS
jgi:hypothetical protein